MAAASSLYGSTDAKSELALDLPVDKQDNQRTNNRHDKAAEIKTIYTAKAEESTNPPPDNCTDDTQNYGNDKSAAVFPGIIHLAKIPAISPKMIHEMIPIANSVLLLPCKSLVYKD